MPEYLSPAVYVEEVGGPRPIEGVSTSTAAMVGVTERGPENVPVLCTSIGDYRRVFGEAPDLAAFTQGSGRVHGHTYLSAKAFFENGGRRDFVLRVLPDGASHATRHLFDRGDATSPVSFLLRGAPQDSGSAVNLPPAYALEAIPALAVGDTLRIGNGSRAEYRTIAGLGDEVHVALGAPLARGHAAGTSVEEHTPSVDTVAYTAGTFVLDGDINAGDATIEVTATAAADAAAVLGLPGDALFEIGTAPRSELRFCTQAEDLGGGLVRLHLAAPLALDHAAGDAVSALALGAASATQSLDTAAGAGDPAIFLDTLAGAFAPGGGRIVVLSPGSEPEARRIATLGRFTFARGAYAAYPPGTRIELVAMADDDRTLTGGTASVFTLDRVDGLAPGMEIAVDGNPPVVIDAIDEGASEVTTRSDALPAAPAGGETVVPAAKATTAAASAGTIILPLDNRLGLEADDVLRIGTGADAEYATIALVMGSRGVAPDAGAVLLTAPLAGDHPNGTEVRRQTPPEADPGRQPAFAYTGAAEGAAELLASDVDSYAAGEIVAVVPPSGGPSYHALSAVDNTLAGIEVEFNSALEHSHALGATLVGREALIEVFALDRGGWGNRLRVGVREPETPLVQARLTSSSAINPVIELSNYTGIEAGTVLEYFDPATGDTVGGLSSVMSVDRAAGEVQLAAVPDPAVTGSAVPLSVRSREFEILVYLLQGPATPGVREVVLDSEVFLVSMHPSHSRYIHRVIGTTWTPGALEDDDGTPLREWDRRSAGESQYIRVRDVAAGNLAVTHSVRLGPELLVDHLVNGLTRPARMPLSGGDDSVATMDDAMYLGIDSNEPRQRTGIHAFQNELTISLLGAPGQTSTAVQQALINHCERDRYRFAVLDGPPPPSDTLVDVQLQRQQFDTKYAALYHPWPTLPAQPTGSIASIRPLPIPPSGPVLGIYARTDVERGVHKAPANEVVRNISGLSRYLNQREQDILNPYPTNINVIRDFRRNNRGIRVWGARCITSDSEFKYVSVRRLMIYVEASIERGLQHVVFEINAEPLWAQVRRSITNFLTIVWRNGALEGTRPEQAFFVRCDRTTMTQTDIDEGRLICLVGIAAVKPAEFVIVRIGLKTATADE
jgi:phage tail sheath protein FI